MAVATVGLAGCDLFMAPAAPERGAGAEAGGEAFSHSQTEDLSGYYSVGEATVGSEDVRLTSLFIGQAAAFEDWEKGLRLPGYAPVMLEFSASGGRVERMVPESYSVSDGRVRLSGRSADGARITFDGQMNTGALATARRNLGGGEAAAVTAVVRIGDQTFSGVKLHWNGGD